MVSRWLRLAAGDVVVFAGSGRLSRTAVITHVFHSPEAAAHLWGHSPTANGDMQTWEYMFSMTTPIDIDIEYGVMNDAIGRAPGAQVREFTVLPEGESNALVALLESLEAAPHRINSPEEYSELVATPAFEQLEQEVVSLRRAEQGYLRKLLVPGPFGRCSLCRRTFSSEFLVAAHIKRRSQCSAEEKLDFTNIAMLNCRFGCDELFGRGFVGVGPDGAFHISTQLPGGPSSAYVDEYLRGATSEHWSKNPGSRRYYAHHLATDFRVSPGA
ncbi:hypothetical protein [Naasia sp. SYSU D00057]|uniref:hypothetical protein n=1 Tax=Naasia sp. SYSU D00057 TaxID=2817380 RepID=UPI001B3134C8|nr:hypothetical protein [Naasia sp. SYSU D00057]